MSEYRIARWESRSGKHFVDLFFNSAFKLSSGEIVSTAWYHSADAGGNLGERTQDEAIAKMQQMVDTGYFQPDANKTPMRRTR